MPPKKNADSEKLDYLVQKIEAMDERLVGIEKIVKKFENMETDVKTIKDEQQEQNKSIEHVLGEVEDVKGELKSLQDQFSEQQLNISILLDTINRLETDRKALRDEMRRNDDYSKRECLLFDGFDEENNENCTDKVMNLIQKKIGIQRDIKFQRCHRLGVANDKRKRPIIVKFMWYQDKQEVLRNAKALKGSTYWIQEFFSETTTNRRKALVPLMRYMQKTKNIKCTLVGDVLYAGKDRYTVETAKKLDFYQEAVTRSDGHVLAFAGQLSILSNFHPSRFKIDGKYFTGVEQYFQSDKADQQGRATVSEQIFNTSDPVQHKRLGGSLKIKDDDWASFACMDRAVRAKFDQNPELLTYLKSTAPLKLVHANAHDVNWANGLAINDANALKETKWKGQNQLGQILMAIRDG